MRRSPPTAGGTFDSAAEQDVVALRAELEDAQ